MIFITSISLNNFESLKNHIVFILKQPHILTVPCVRKNCKQSNYSNEKSEKINAAAFEYIPNVRM